MTMAICDVGRKGRLDLRFTPRDGRTVLSESYCEVPYKITRLLESGSSSPAHLILMQCTAGIFGGDELECSIHVESGARVRITQQSATKIHPSEGRLARQSTRIRVDSDAELVFDLEPVIPFASSRFCQNTSIEAVSGARLVFWEGLMAGRIGREEIWQFDELASETRLSVDGSLKFLDRFGLFPHKQPLNSTWVAGAATYVGTGLYLGTDAPQVAECLHEALPDAGVDSPAPDLTVVRVVSTSGPDFHQARAVFTRSDARGQIHR